MVGIERVTILRTDSNYIRTASGGRFWPLDPSPNEIDIEDIAHALANQCRWTGHTREFFSVAQHSILVSELCLDYPMEGLLHDASEAYLVDLARPIKKAPGLGEIYMKVEAAVEQVIAARYGLVWPWPTEVKAADDVLLRTEWRDLMSRQEEKAGSELAPGLPVLAQRLSPETPKMAKAMFLERFEELQRAAVARN